MVKKFYEICIPNVGYGQFIYGEAGWLRKFDSADWDKSLEYEIISRNCQLNPDHKNAIRTAELKVILPSPNIGDFVWTFYSECLITDRVLDLFKEARFTGFDVREVEIVRIKRIKKTMEYTIPKLWEFVATGKGGDAHPDSGIKALSQCEECNSIRYSSYTNGIIVDDSQWDGSDFFTVNGYPAHILVTEQVKQLVINHKLVNCAIISSDQLQWGSHVRPEEIYKG